METSVFTHAFNCKKIPRRIFPDGPCSGPENHPLPAEIVANRCRKLAQTSKRCFLARHDHAGAGFAVFGSLFDSGWNRRICIQSLRSKDGPPFRRLLRFALSRLGLSLSQRISFRKNRRNSDHVSSGCGLSLESNRRVAGGGGRQRYQNFCGLPDYLHVAGNSICSCVRDSRQKCRIARGEKFPGPPARTAASSLIPGVIFCEFPPDRNFLGDYPCNFLDSPAFCASRSLRYVEPVPTIPKQIAGALFVLRRLRHPLRNGPADCPSVR